MQLDGYAHGGSDRRRNTRSLPSIRLTTLGVRLPSAASEGPRQGSLEQVQVTKVDSTESGKARE